MKNREELVRFLLERSSETAAGPPLKGLSRRAFLGGTIGAAVVTGALLRSGNGSAVPQVDRIGVRVRVVYRSREWILDPAAFGSAARVNLSREGSGWGIRAHRAHLPGTDLSVDMIVRIFARAGEWWIDLKLPALNFASQSRLGAWLSGAKLTGAHRAVAFSVAGGGFTIPTGQLQVSLAPTLTFAFGTCTVRGLLQCAAQGAVLVLRHVDDGALHRRMEPDFDGTHATTFALRDARLARRKFGFGVPGQMGLLRPDAGTRVEGELVGKLGINGRQVILFMGGARVERCGKDGSVPVRLCETAALLTHDSMHVAGRVTPEPFTIALSGSSLTVSGDEAAPFAAHFARGRPAAFDITLRAEQLRAPIDDGDGALIALAGTPIELRAGDVAHPERKRGLSRRGDARATERVVVYGRQDETVVRAPLDGATITLRRNADLVNLTFSLDGFDLRMGYFGAMIVRRHRLGQPWKAARITVQFPPQHMAETIYRVDNAAGCTAETDRKFQTHLSEKPRLVFSLPEARKRREAVWRRRRLTIEAMTDWSELVPVVGPRSFEAIGVDANAQLEAAGVVGDAAADKTSALAAIRASFAPPTQDQTALELTRNLIFSPSEKARWVRPKQDPTSHVVPLWNLRLDPLGRKTVRAVWSKVLDPDPKARIPSANAKFDVDPLNALSGPDHWDIVGQTSVYGFSALRGVKSEAAGPTGASVSKGGVILPDPKPGYMDLEEGLAIATPFQDADITLTSLGAIVRAEWIGEPARVRMDSVKAFSLERLSIETWLGRDIRIVAQRKGFLMPLGIRCTYVTVAERRFLEVGSGKLPISREILRNFLLTHGRQKAYPALDHPDEARDFPAGLVRMLTRSTPDLVDPRIVDPSIIGPIGPDKLTRAGRYLPGGEIDTLLVFWPRIAVEASPKSETRDVDFKWAIDDSTAPVVGNLLYVENSAIDNRDVVRDLHAYYNGLQDDALRLRTHRHAGASRRYAPPIVRRMPGDPKTEVAFDTAFDTDAWVLRVRSREVEGVPNFAMDARMEGADQPPFYPAVDRAQVHVQSLDRLLGRAQGAVTVGFDPRYTREGFVGGNRGAEIFLDVLFPRIELDAGAQGDATGGVAKPGAVVAALSRKTGIVGGRDRLQPEALKNGLLASSRRLATAPTAASAEPPFDFESARQGTFDPREFFGNRLTILGINLLEVLQRGTLDTAPKLIETMDFGPGGADALRRLREVAALARARLGNRHDGKLLNTIDTALAAQHMGHSARELYPDFAAAYDLAAEALVTELPTLAAAVDMTTVMASATRIAPAVKPLLPRIVELLRAPVPPALQSELGELLKQWQLARDALRNPEGLIRRIVDQVAAEALVEFCQGDNGLAAMRLLHIETKDCAALIQTPRTVLGKVGETLYRDVFGEDVARMLEELRDIRDALGDVEAMAHAEAMAFLMQTAQAAFRGARRMAVFAEVAKARERLQQWCTSGTGALVIAVELCQHHIGATKLDEFAKQAAALVPPSSGVAATQFEQSRAALLQAIARLKGFDAEIEDKLAALKTFTGCDAGQFLDTLAESFVARNRAIGTLREVVQWLATLEQLDQSAAFMARARPTAGTTLRSQAAGVQQLRALAIAATQSLTLIEKVAKDDPVWKHFRTAAGQAMAAAKDAAAYVAEFDATLKTTTETAVALNKALLQAATARELAVVTLQVEDFVRRQEQRLAALILQPVAVAKATADTMGRSARRAVLQCLMVIKPPHEAILGALQKLNVLLNLSPMVKLLVGTAALGGLQEAQKALGEDVQALGRLELALSDREFLDALQEIARRWERRPALLVTFERFAQVMDAFAKANFGHALGDAARTALQALEEEARVLISELVPAKVTTKYHWQTKLGDFGPFLMDPHADDDLRLDSTISFDLLTKQRKVEVVGALKPFTIFLLEGLPMVNLKFQTCTFVSRDGKSPDFDFQVENVELLPLLEFLKPLQQWMSPGKENGPYIQLLLPPGIRAGYRYDAGLIQVGSLQFDGLVLDAYAILPFGDGPARFGFDFASEDHPFTVSNPPYGGGGYVSIVATAKRIDTLVLSMVMGAVTAIKFGPLNARGRVVAGFKMVKYGNGGMTIGAFVEAVGEGSIACFSICVFIRVQLFHYANGSVVGSARYSFTFKIGRWFKVKYGFTAKYTIKGGKKEGRTLVGGDGGAAILLGDRSRRIVDVPKKASEWHLYRAHVAMDLLDKEDACPIA